MGSQVVLDEDSDRSASFHFTSEYLEHPPTEEDVLMEELRREFPLITTHLKGVYLPKIPEVELKVANFSEMHYECSVCQEKLQPRIDKFCLLECWHFYHYECMVRWLRAQKGTCPACRDNVTRMYRLSPETPRLSQSVSPPEKE